MIPVLAKLDATQDRVSRRWIAGTAIGAGWLLLGGPILRGLAASFAEADARPHLVLAGLLLCAALLRATKSGRGLLCALTKGPRAQSLPLALLIVAAIVLCAGRYLHLPDTLLALPFCIGSYGLLGLYQKRESFRRGLPLLLLVLLLVPFQFHLDAMFGFQVRLLIAKLVHVQLCWLGVSATAVQSILVIDGSAAHIDLPCSGLRSLWSGALFYLCLSWLRSARLGMRWLLGLLTVLIVILYLNQLRVFLLVLLANVLHQPALAARVHVPLGLLFFMLACALASQLLRPEPVADADAEPPAPPLRPVAVALLCGGLLFLSWAAAAAGAPEPLSAPVVQLPPSFRATPRMPSSAEADLYARHPGVLHKWRFSIGTPTHPERLPGSMLISISRSFLAQHPPHVCLATLGLEVTGARSIELRTGEFMALLDIGRGRRSAVYWFQSATQTTDNPLRRSLAALPLSSLAGTTAKQPAAWALVSILFDGPLRLDDLDEPALHAQLLELHDAVAKTLRGIP